MLNEEIKNLINKYPYRYCKLINYDYNGLFKGKYKSTCSLCRMGCPSNSCPCDRFWR